MNFEEKEKFILKQAKEIEEIKKRIGLSRKGLNSRFKVETDTTDMRMSKYEEPISPETGFIFMASAPNDCGSPSCVKLGA